MFMKTNSEKIGKGVKFERIRRITGYWLVRQIVGMMPKKPKNATA